MGAKKKGKANKLARMSEEERIRYLQHRAAIEEEARRRKEQLISAFMKNKLKREEVFSRLNMAKINQQWRQTLRQIKCIELKQDVEDLFKWFDYSSNKKNKIIEMLLDDLDEAESQYSRMHNSHTETIYKLIKLHGQRVGHFFEQYKQERNEIHEKTQTDLNDIIIGFEANEEHLQAILYSMEKVCQEKISAITSQKVSKIDEMRNNMLTELENLKNTRELQKEKIWLDLTNVLTQYYGQTEDRRRQYILMREIDHEKSKQIFENNHQINALTDTINNLKEQLSNVHLTKNESSLRCKAKKENARQLLYSLKKRVSEEMENDDQKLTFMNTIACKTTEELKKILAKGEQVLQMHSLCRKLETLNEKICPEGFDKTQLTEEEENELEGQTEKYAEPLAKVLHSSNTESSNLDTLKLNPAKTYEDVVELDEFWKRYNRALLEKEALTLHYQSLQNEQKQLKSILRRYLSDTVVKRPESKVSHANGVQILRQRPHSFAATRRKPNFSGITCIESTQSPSIRKIISAQIRS